MIPLKSSSFPIGSCKQIAFLPAFYNCTDLKKITIPEFVTYIGNDVFKNCRNLVIYGKRDSVAERYAYINNIKFVSGQYKVVFKDNGRTVHTILIKVKTQLHQL